jgi:predicted phage terminase large subunit-like protein
VRFWDLAATLPEAGKDPDYLAGVLVHRYDDLAPYNYVIGDLKRDRLSPAGVGKLIVQTAMLDGRHIPIRIEQEGGAGAKMNIDYLTRQLPGWDVRGEVVSGKGSKLTRAGPLSRQAEIGNVAVLARDWTDVLLGELEGFPEGAHDDIVDACSGAFWYLTDPSRKRQMATVKVDRYA